jgi:hypothetical protein
MFPARFRNLHPPIVFAAFILVGTSVSCGEDVNPQEPDDSEQPRELSELWPLLSLPTQSR